MTAKVRQDGRKGFLFCTGAAAVAGGLLLGRAGVLVDCLLVLGLCLSAAVVVVALSAKSVKEIRGFGTLAIAATAASLAMCTAAGRLILTQGAAGRIVELLAAGFVREHLIFAALIFFAGGGIVWIFIARTLMGIRRTAASFVKGECSDEYASFFEGMRKGAGFMMFAAITEACVAVSVTAGGSVIGSREAALAVTMGAVTLTMGAGCILGSRYLVGRAGKSAEWEGRGDMVEWVPTAKTVVSEVVCDEESAATRIEEAAIEIDGVEVEEVQWYDEVEENCVPRFWNGAEMRDKGNCERVAERIIAGARGSNRVVLLAAAERKELGVTASVNIAMCLAHKGRKCLLVDMDTDRDAVSRVFDTGGKGLGAVKTCIGNLWVQSGWEGQGQWKDEYDHVVLYSPDKRWWPRGAERKWIPAFAGMTKGESAVMAMLFGSGENHSISEFREELSAWKVKILEPECVTADL